MRSVKVPSLGKPREANETILYDMERFFLALQRVENAEYRVELAKAKVARASSWYSRSDEPIERAEEKVKDSLAFFERSKLKAKAMLEEMTKLYRVSFAGDEKGVGFFTLEAQRNNYYGSLLNSWEKTVFAAKMSRRVCFDDPETLKAILPEGIETSSF